MSSSTIVESMAGHPEIGTVVPSDLEMERLEGAAQTMYGLVKGAGLEHDQVSAFEAFAAVGRDLASSPETGTPEIASVLGNFVAQNSFKVLIVKGFAPKEGELPPTPDHYLTPEENPVLPVDTPRGLMFGMAGLEAYGYRSQQPGNLWNNVVAIRGAGGSKGASANAKDMLGLHTEDASYNKVGGVLEDGTVLDDSYDSSPDILSIHFLRNPLGIPTTVSAPDFTMLSGKARRNLTLPYFLNRTNPGQGGAENDIHVPVSVLYGDPDKPFVRANTDNLVVVDGLKPAEKLAADVALAELIDLFVDATVKLDSEPGDIIFVDNKFVAHGRSLYPEGATEEQIYGPDSRFQRRLVAARSLSRISHYTDAPRIAEPKILGDRIVKLSAS